MPFSKGVSGNPKGRKPGTTTAQRLRAGLERHVPGILGALVQQALDGDTAAAKLLLERTIPPLKPVELPVQIPVAGGTESAIQAVMEAVAGGQLPPQQATALLHAIAAAHHAATGADLESRISRLEAEHHGEQRATTGAGGLSGSRNDPAEGQGDEHRGVAGLGGGCAVDARPDG